jgi:hypothetical protein
VKREETRRSADLAVSEKGRYNLWPNDWNDARELLSLRHRFLDLSYQHDERLLTPDS